MRRAALLHASPCAAHVRSSHTLPLLLLLTLSAAPAHTFTIHSSPTGTSSLCHSAGIISSPLVARHTRHQTQPTDGLLRLRGGGGGIWAWLGRLRALLFPGNPSRERSLPPPPQPEKKETTSASKATSKPASKGKGGRRGASTKGGGVQEIHSKAEFEKMLKAVRGKQLVVVDFFATWCGPCKQIAPKYEAMANALPHVKFVKVDVDQAKDLSQQYGVSAMPTFKMLRGGKEVGSMQGADDAALREKVEGLAGKPDRWAAAGSGRKL